jgi:NADPH-dependent 2,4-dienoyl-CoA reductase/sulfur reductase-like enzyme
MPQQRRRFKHLIVGGGMTADAAIRGIRELDPEGTIGLIGSESDPPYNRPPLTKGLWKGKNPDSIWRGTDKLGVDLRLGRTVRAVDSAARTVSLDGGEEIAYDQLLLATGGSPRRLPFMDEGIIYYRTYRDYERLRALASEDRQFAVIGGGFIGSEIAAALAMNKRRVAMVFPEPTIGARIFPRDLGLFVNETYRSHGVQLRPSTAVAGMTRRGDRLVLSLRGERRDERLEADVVIAGVGIEPNVELARSAGLSLEGGVVVDEYLRTSRPGIYAAGDVAVFHNPTLGRMRVEHEDNANTMGHQAGRNMAGAGERYRHLPFFYSDLFDLGYEAVGETDSRLEVVADWVEPNRKGVVCYLKQGQVRGVLLWNVWEQVPAARRLIEERGPFTAESLKGKLLEMVKQR